MTPLPILVDFDNIDAKYRSQGPVNLAKMLVGILPPNLVYPYDGISVRLYGGWRSMTGQTAAALDLQVVIERESPVNFSVMHLGQSKLVRVNVSLARGPSFTRKVLPETLAKNRPLRHFKALGYPWRECASHENCGLSILNDGHNATPCQTTNCMVRIGDILVRDEQKMVDTLMVADIAHEAFVSCPNDIVVVSSDADVWPGIFLALNQGKYVTQIHSSAGWTTSRDLLRTLEHVEMQRYRQFSIKE